MLLTSCSVELSRFLEAAAASDVPLAPSVAIDEEWHRVLADPGAYGAQCRAELGRVVPHVETERPAHVAYARTRAVLLDRYGELDERFWPVDGAAVCYAGPVIKEPAPPPPPPGG
jgi:hypothetical protein